jgi:hypothetical protein
MIGIDTGGKKGQIVAKTSFWTNLLQKKVCSNLKLGIVIWEKIKSF